MNSFQTEGSNESISPKQPPLNEENKKTYQNLNVSGNLIHNKSGYPLPGLKVSAYFVEPVEKSEYTSNCIDSPEDTLIGESVSKDNGEFSIHFLDTLTVRQKLAALTQVANSELVLKVLDEDNTILLVSAPISITSKNFSVTLSVSFPDLPMSKDTQLLLSERLEKIRIVQLHEIALALSSMDGSPFFKDWSLSFRFNILFQLEQAFLDPTGLLREVASPLPTFNEIQMNDVLKIFEDKVQPHLQKPEIKQAYDEWANKIVSFPDLFQVDWPINLNLLRQGRLGTALNYFYDFFNNKPIDNIHVRPLFQREDNVILYRDYLREIWAKWITKSEIPNWDLNLANEQLQNRFHQPFFTTNTKKLPANEIIIPIVKKILTAPTGGNWGFGIDSLSIESQNNRTSREYLDYLINFTGLSAQELGLRYCIDLERSDSIISSPVEENISTLQCFYRDMFQSSPDPEHTEPDILNEPIIPRFLQGEAPFFLYFDEWLNQKAPFYAENFFDIRSTLPFLNVWPENIEKTRKQLLENIKNSTSSINWNYIADVWEIYDTLQVGHEHYYHGEYGLAKETYKKAESLAESQWVPYKYLYQNSPNSTFLHQRKKWNVKNQEQLLNFMHPSNFGNDMSNLHHAAVAHHYYTLFVIPVCLADVYLALGEYEKSVYYYGKTTWLHVGTAKESDIDGYNYYTLGSTGIYSLFNEGNLPYTVKTQNYKSVEKRNELNYSYPYKGYGSSISKIYVYIHYVEAKYFQLRHGNAMLEWADSLYRTNETANIQRARELYKGVLFLHGEKPDIMPEWSTNHIPWLPNKLKNLRENPALVLQKERARLGFIKIDAGLNYFGERDDLVPHLRYRPLKETADRFAALAKAAQQDFLLYLDKVENAIIERLKLTNLIQKASLQVSMAEEQTTIAEYNVKLAEDQVTDIEEQIEAKRKEISDKDSILSQYSDFIGGIIKVVKDLPDDTKSAYGSSFQAEAGLEAMKGKGMLGMGSAATVMTGFAAFGVLGYMSMSNMADAANVRIAELKTLENKVLPRAKEMVETKKNEVTIASLHKRIIQADMTLSRSLIAFEENRILNLNFWVDISQVVKRMLHRYLELGARAAWLAERALSYELNRDISMIRFDYFPESLQGISGANLLEMDLAELEALHIEGIKKSIPVKHTISLARDYPLQYGQLKKTGHCLFKTAEMPLSIAYPGTESYRIRAVTINVSQSNFIQPIRGTLIHQGISVYRPGKPDESMVIRPSEGLPISEFYLPQDMPVFGLPNETLMPFEGSSLDSFWELRLPLESNVSGLSSITDVLLTFDLWGQYTSEQYSKWLLEVPTKVRRSIMISGKQYNPKAIEQFMGTNQIIKFDFNLRLLPLPNGEKNRKVRNISLGLVTPLSLDVQAELHTLHPPLNINFSFNQNLALSSLTPMPGNPVSTSLPLNAFDNSNVDQTFQLIIKKQVNPGVDFRSVSDILFIVEYEADL